MALAHPLIPFETEEIYSHIPGAEGLLAARITRPDDAGADGHLDDDAEAAVTRAIGAIQALRRWRDQSGVKARAIVSAVLDANGYTQTLEHVARLAAARTRRRGRRD